MRLFLITDMEGCAGVLNSTDWCFPGGRCYETGRMLLTEEVNAAVRGFLEHGFDEVLVADAHGLGGLDLLRLDERVRYQRGFAGPYPLGMTPDFDAVAWVGQHAKAGTPFAHLAHTSSMRVVDQRINGISVGEFGMSVFMGVVMGIQPIFGSGDLAFCKEAAALCPEMITVSVKEGVIPGSGRECLTEEYRERNTAAIHLHPLEARRGFTKVPARLRAGLYPHRKPSPSARWKHHTRLKSIIGQTRVSSTITVAISIRAT